MAAGEAICCICSRSKDKNTQALRAEDRYTGTHIGKVAAIAREEKQQLFILSGVHGFIHASTWIRYYDHLLQPHEVDALARQIKLQLRYYQLTQVHFYTKKKPTWQPYLLAITEGAKLAKVSLVINYLEDDE